MLSQRTGSAKLDDVTRILSELKADLDAKKLSTQQKQQLLEQLKVYGRSVENSDPIFTEDGLRTLGRHAFDGETTVASQEALRCIANALLLQPKTRQILVDLGHGPHAAEKLKGDSIDNEFLASRILFLTTYDTSLDYAQLVRENQLAESINAAITRHAKRYSKSAPAGSKGHSQPMELMALAETLKLVFNIIHFHKDLSAHFTPSISHVFKILVRRGVTEPPLTVPARELINVLLHLDLEDSEGQKAVFPPFEPRTNARHLIGILYRAILAYPPKEPDDAVAPVLTLIRRIYEIAPEDVKNTMEEMLLPTTEERDKPLGKSNTLSSRLLNLSTSALTPALRGSISSMLFELSHKDPATFVHNVGYGYASGFLMSNNITMPEELVKANAPAGDVEGIPVNPITGQRLDKEEHVQMEPMTQEEKEREAERLFVLFERLKATGVMDVQNPVEEAYRSGRIQELPDDESD
ncbi:guanine nucleotide exchange factor [Alternaria rosae]|uniref:guanine nucleotide exchange factor n=1 Tax=Alternaria rosae TaxID=1187941 RepID=UPI001E8DF72F|nr:guanine nucleotide exchange factor [Alternaria rosae]KAH6881305.1 guanine nucleotide exchange factor [Alternaria rosae]